MEDKKIATKEVVVLVNEKLDLITDCAMKVLELGDSPTLRRLIKIGLVVYIIIALVFVLGQLIGMGIAASCP